MKSLFTGRRRWRCHWAEIKLPLGSNHRLRVSHLAVPNPSTPGPSWVSTCSNSSPRLPSKFSSDTLNFRLHFDYDCCFCVSVPVCVCARALGAYHLSEVWHHASWPSPSCQRLHKEIAPKLISISYNKLACLWQIFFFFPSATCWRCRASKPQRKTKEN